MIMLNEKERKALESILEKAIKVHETGRIETETTAGMFRGLCILFEESNPPPYAPEDDLWGFIERILNMHGLGAHSDCSARKAGGTSKKLEGGQ